MLAHEIQYVICKEAQHSSFSGFAANSTTDVSTCKQFLCSMQFKEASLVPHKVFLGFYTVPHSKMKSLFLSIKGRCLCSPGYEKVT